MGDITDIRTRIDDLGINLDEIFMMVDEQGEQLEALHQEMQKQDTIHPIVRKHIILLSNHIERLIKEKEMLMAHLQIVPRKENT